MSLLRHSLRILQSKRLRTITVSSLLVMLIAGASSKGDILRRMQFQAFRPQSEAPRCTQPATALPYSTPPVPIVAKLKSNEVHCYEIKVKDNQFFHVVIMQKDVDLEAQLFRITGQATKALEQVGKTIDSPNEFNGPEPVSEGSSVASTYLLVVDHSRGTNSPGETYSIALEDLHDATEKDRKYVRAERNYLEGWSRSNSAGFAQTPDAAKQALNEGIELLKRSLTELADTDRPRFKLKVVFRI